MRYSAQIQGSTDMEIATNISSNKSNQQDKMCNVLFIHIFKLYLYAKV
jgi:hypothetical protein